MGSFRSSFLHFSISLLILTLSLFSVYSKNTTVNPITFSGVLPTPEDVIDPSITLVPTVTQKLSIVITGTSESLSFIFTQDTSTNDLYRLQILNGRQTISSQVAQFKDQETLTLSLDTQKNLFLLQGDKRFRITKTVKEKSYILTITEEKVVVIPDPNPDDKPPENNPKNGNNGADSKTAYAILAGIVGGIIGLVVVIKVIVTLIDIRRSKKIAQEAIKNAAFRKREVEEEKDLKVPALIFEDQTPDVESPIVKCTIDFEEQGFNDKIFSEDKISSEDKIYSDEKILSENDIEHLPPISNRKREFPSSLSSIGSGNEKAGTAATFPKSSGSHSQGTVPSSHSVNTNSSANSLQFLSKDLSDHPKSDENSNGGSKGSYNELNKKGKKVNTLASIAEESDIRKTTIIAETTKSIMEKYEKKPAKSQILPFRKEPSEPKYQLTIETPKKPTKASPGNSAKIYPKSVNIDDLRHDVEKAIKQKEKEKEDSDSISDEEEEIVEEDENKDDPINFFTCMVCSKGKRTAIVKPCGHIFSCRKCARKIAKTNNECLMCGKKVRGYYDS